MAAARTITIRFLGDTSNLNKATTNGEKQLGGFTTSVKSFATKIAAGFAAVKAVQWTKDAIGMASDLAETQSKVGELFGAASKDIEAYAANAAKSLGQTRQQALDANATFAIFGKSAGLQGQELSGFTTQLTTLASDLASFNNTSPEDAIEAIGAALRGETEPMRRYGVLLDDASLRNEALRQGLIKNTKTALTPQQKVLAAQALILKQTTAAQGDFARTSGGLANQTKILRARLEDAQTSLGAKLLPVVLKGVTLLSKLADFVERNQKVILPLIAAFAGLAVGIKVVTVATAAWNAVSTANPIGIVIVAIAALVAGLVVAYQKSETFRNIVQAVFGWIKKNWPLLLGIITGPIGLAVVAIIKNWDKIKAGVTAVKDWIVTKFTEVVGWLKGLPSKVTSAVTGLWDGLTNGFRAAINWIITKWNNLKFHVPGIKIGPVGYDGFDIDFPDLPLLGRKFGGPVTAGRTYLVGENGPELLRMGGNGNVTPNSALGGPETLELHLDLGEGIAKVFSIKLRETNRLTRRRVLSGAAA